MTLQDTHDRKMAFRAQLERVYGDEWRKHYSDLDYSDQRLRDAYDNYMYACGYMLFKGTHK